MGRSSRRIALLVAAALALAAGPARAHGPEVSVSAEGANPAELRVERGATVHFTNRAQVPLRVRGEGDSFHSPLLAPGEGWHLPLPFPGTFPYRVEREDGAEVPAARGAIVVGESG